MTDTAIRTTVDWSGADAIAHRRRRYGADRRLQMYGIGAIVIAIGLLATLIISLSLTGYRAFVQTMIGLGAS